MTDNEFDNLYWKQYLMIEKEFKTTEKYVAINSINFATYSDEYAKILLQIGSEIDVVAKKLCCEVDSSFAGESINTYVPKLEETFADFLECVVSCEDIDICPWAEWSPSRPPSWWTVYNKVKHFRADEYNCDGIIQESYKFANLKNVIYALAGLYQLELYLFSVISHDPNLDTPIPGSRLFQLKGERWKNKRFAQDILFYTDCYSGDLCSISSSRTYADI